MTACPPDLRRRIALDLEREEKSANYRSLAAKWRASQAKEAVAVAASHPIPTVGNFAWNEDMGYLDGARFADEVSATDRAFAFSAEGEFLALSKQKTGETLSDDILRDRRRASAELLAQSHAIAEKMDAEWRAIHAEEAASLAILSSAAGADSPPVTAPESSYRETPFGLWRYYVHSRHVEKIPAFRRVMFIPYVSQMVRGPMLSALEYWLEKNLHARFWTFTSGIRVELSGVRERAQWLHRRLSELSAQPFMRAAGMRLVFRSTELGTPETNASGSVISNAGEIERDETGQLYFHVHAHCVVEMTRGPLVGAKWKKLLTDVHAFWKTPDGKRCQWDDGGSIRDAREACKYVTKPGEMLKLTGAELVALQAQLSRLKLVQPMGSLAEEIKAREARGDRLVRKRTPDGPVFAEVKNWNKHTHRTREEKAADAAAKLERKSASASARVLSRLLPGFGPSGVSEPRVVIMAQKWEESDVRGLPQVARLIEATAHEFWAGSAIRVHTCTSTVGETSAFDFVSTLPPPRNIPTGAELAGLTR